MNIKTQCACVDDNKTIWIFSDDYNGLFKYDLENDELTFVKSNPYEKIQASQLYNGAEYYNGNIFFFPICAKGIGVYNINNNKFEIVDIPNRNGIIYYNIVKIAPAKILLYPIINSNYAYVLDMNNKKIQLKELNYGQYSELIMENRLILGSAIIEKKAYFVFANTKFILEYDWGKNKISVSEIFCDSRLFSSISKNEKMYCINSEGTTIYIIDNNKVVKKFDLDKRKLIGDGRHYGGYTVTCKDEIFCVPEIEDNLILIKKNNERKLINLKDESSKNIVAPFIAFMTEIDECIIGIPYNGSYGFMYNCINEKYKILQFKINKKSLNKIISLMSEDGCYIIQEGTVLDLVDYINYF